MKKTRRRIKGKIAGLCSTYIASLAGVAPVTVRRWKKQQKSPITIEQLRSFIFEQECKHIIENIRKNCGIDLSDRFDSILSGARPK